MYTTGLIRVNSNTPLQDRYPQEAVTLIVWKEVGCKACSKMARLYKTGEKPLKEIKGHNDNSIMYFT